jgi:hypothetical protein
MSQSSDSTTEPNPFTKPGFIISAALVVALIAAVVVIFLLPKGEDSAQSSPATTGAGSSASASPKASKSVDDSVCGLPAGSETALGTAPTSNWELVDRIATPTDPGTFGPGVTDESGFRSCFANSPTGALYAAMNVVALGSSGSPELVEKLSDKLLVPGVGRDAAMKDAATGLSTDDGSTIQVRGFIIRSYTPTEADIDLVFETNKGALARISMSLRWMDGDWKVKPADDGTPFSGMAQVSDLSGFLLWSGI